MNEGGFIYTTIYINALLLIKRENLMLFRKVRQAFFF